MNRASLRNAWIESAHPDEREWASIEFDQEWPEHVELANYLALRSATKEVVASLVPKYHPDHPEDHGFSFETGRILADLLRRE